MEISTDWWVHNFMLLRNDKNALCFLANFLCDHHRLAWQLKGSVKTTTDSDCLSKIPDR